MDREEMLNKVDTLYEGRATGDLSKFGEVMTAGATFSFAGEKSLIAAFPGGRTSDPGQVAEALYRQIDMLDREVVQTFVDGKKLAVLWKTKLRVKGRQPFDQMLFDIWEFDDADKICRGTQFQDTAKIIEEVTAGGFQNAT